MKVQVKSTTLHELMLDEDGVTPTGQVYSLIPSVLDDDTADDYEKVRTIVCAVKGACPDSIRADYSVFVFDDEGLLFFSGDL